MRERLIILVVTILATNFASAQSKLDSIFNKLDPQKWSAAIEKKVSRLEEKMIAKSEKALRKLQKEDEKIYKKLLASKDSLAVKAQLEEIRSRYAVLQQKLKNPSPVVSAGNVREYVAWLDTAQSALQFLDQQGIGGNIKDALSKVESFNGRLQQADEIKRFIRERRDQLRLQLENLGLVKDLKKINKEIFYYAETLKEIKSTIQDKRKLERKAFELLSQTKLFKDFMKKNSLLASMFRVPVDPNDPTALPSLAGLQTRAQINGLIMQQIGASGPDAMAQVRQNLQGAQSQLQQLKERFNLAASGSSDMEMPEGFRPKNLKTKSLLERIEIGTNIQSQRSKGLLPSNSEIALSVGYKLSEKSIVGLAGVYRVGWGRDINHINITHEGLGFRSYFDFQLKNSFWMSAGFEMNYRSAFNRIEQLRLYDAWQRSGLVGISKIVSVKSKLLKKTKVQVLWDYLWASQTPKANPIVFRIGYSFK